MKYHRFAEDKESQDDPVREKDLKGHIKSANESESKIEERQRKELGDMSQDNQLKSAVDILKSWALFRKTR